MSEIPLIVVPDPDEPDGAEVLVDGTVGGRPYRFLLDTGAGRSSVLHDEYTATFPSAGTHTSSGVFAASRADLVVVPELAVGPLARTNFSLVRVPSGPGPRNLIAMDLLKDYCCHFRFDERRVIVGHHKDVPAGGPFHELLLDSKAHPYVEVQIEDASAQAVWDTGASITIVHAGFVDAHPAWFQAAGTSTGTDATGATQQTPMAVMAASVIGGCRFPPLRVAAVNLSAVNATIEVPMDMILGYNVLAQAHWLFDFPGGRWRITKCLEQR